MKIIRDHQWIETDGKTAKISLTKETLKDLGEIVHFQLPKIGQVIQKGEMAVILESTKSATEIEAPLSGKVIAVNDNAYEWLYELELSDVSEISSSQPPPKDL